MIRFGRKILPVLVIACASLTAAQEDPLDRDRRMEWWREARFGLFVHWGMYAELAGEWEGQRVQFAEWIRHFAQIPSFRYDSLVSGFHPTRYDPLAWVNAAKQAGMKYIIFTAKHHDGFCMFNSQYTDFDIMSAPYQRDVIEELARACDSASLKLGFYYSIMDWHHPDYIPKRPWDPDTSSALSVYSRYVEYMKSQLNELLSNYGDVGILWFDGEWEDTWTRELGNDLYEHLRGVDSTLIINNRVSKARYQPADDCFGDFGTPEQEVPDTGLGNVDWETCLTMGESWGYSAHDTSFKPTGELLQTLADVASKGGNLLLNVGPKADGTFPEESLRRLEGIGEWMSVNGESIYGTTASPLGKFTWGRCTERKFSHWSRLYLHVFSWPQQGALQVPGVANPVVGSYLLSDTNRASLPVQVIGTTAFISLPGRAPDATNTVVVLDVDLSGTASAARRSDLFQNYPNPFSTTTTIQYAVVWPGRIVLGIYDVLGRETSRLIDEHHLPGMYQAVFEPGDIASGVYFYRLQDGAGSLTRKMVYVR